MAFEHTGAQQQAGPSRAPDGCGTAGPRTLISSAPATGATVGTFPIADRAAVDVAVGRARDASGWWAGLGFDGRRERLGAWRMMLARRMDELAGLVHSENGKPPDDALLEIVSVIDHLAWAAANARRVLGPRRVRSGSLGFNVAASVVYRPYGVVGVIGPWNYPVLTPMGSIVYALAAGNAVVYKPSEYTPAVGRWLADSFAEAVSAAPGPDVFRVVTGDGATGAALCRADIDKLAFTGSASTGRRVMAACAERLTPVVMECGGKDAVIVAADADLEAAADAVVWGAMSNAGQTCIGIERAYVVDPVHDRFLDMVRERVAGLTPGTDYGPITMPGQLDTISRHIDAALEAGATPVSGGRNSIQPPYAHPVVLADIPEECAATREETFGPTLGVQRVADVEEAIERVNASPFGLGSAVFTASATRGLAIAARLRSGMTAVNAVMSFTAVPGLPFGGVGESGFGRIHGDDGLREFAWPKSIARQRFRLPVDPLTFSRPRRTVRSLATVMRWRHGRR